MLFGQKTYAVLKFIAQILLPALGTLYFALAQIWHLPKAEEIVGTVVAVDTFLGVLLGISTNLYNKSGDKYSGTIEVTDSPTKQKYLLNVNGDPETVFADKDEVVFKVEQVDEDHGRHERP